MHTQTLMATKSCQHRIIPFSGSHYHHLCQLLVTSLTFQLILPCFFSNISLKQDQWWAGGFPLTEPWQELPEVPWQREYQVAASFLNVFFLLLFYYGFVDSAVKKKVEARQAKPADCCSEESPVRPLPHAWLASVTAKETIMSSLPPWEHGQFCSLRHRWLWHLQYSVSRS